MSKPKIIAFYLPQFHSTPDNDKWWGKDFTDWTNVRQAVKLYPGHPQPRIPADLGYYDLTDPMVKEKQAELAKKAGIYGFCYWTYWFGGGKEELETPLNQMLSSEEPDFPFMIAWANESWYRKQWKNGAVCAKELLVEQTYPGTEDIEAQFYRYLPAFRDRRYIRIKGKPAFLVYKPQALPPEFIPLWNKLAREERLADGFFFIAHVISLKEQRMTEAECRHYYRLHGFDAINFVRLSYPFEQTTVRGLLHKAFYRLFNLPVIYRYSTAIKFFSDHIDREEDVYPTIIPNWDHTPRSGRGGWVLRGSDPQLFKKHIAQMLANVDHKHENFNYVFLKSWNEWGEGNYMEPDTTWGHQYIDALGETLQHLD